MPPSADILKGKLRQAGAFTVGFAPLREVPPEVMDAYTAWIAAGHHGGMDYLANHIGIRRNPALLLDGGEDPRPGGTVISMAFPYCSGDPYHPGRLRIARYALGDDYHEVLRQRLRPIAAWITGETGKEARICVDTAPILERHWAREAGLGFIGRNRQLIIPGHGPCFFLAEIVTRAVFPPDAPCTLTCGDCDACVRSCPGHALGADNFDGRRCHSYLTIEHHGEFPPGFIPRKDSLYGCDICIEVCPHYRRADSPAPLPEFLPRESLLDLTVKDVTSLTPVTFSTLLRHSPIKRAKLAGLLRNASHLSSAYPYTDRKD